VITLFQPNYSYGCFVVEVVVVVGLLPLGREKKNINGKMETLQR